MFKGFDDKFAGYVNATRVDVARYFRRYRGVVSPGREYRRAVWAVRARFSIYPGVLFSRKKQ